MRLAATVRHRLRAAFRRGRLEAELDEEIRYHIERGIEEDLAKGLTREEAQRNAQRSLMGVESRKEECRDVRGLNLMDNLLRDFRFALRQLRKTPVFTSVAVLVLALGLSAAIAIFAYVDAALVRPLPYADPGRLLSVTGRISILPRANLSYLDFRDWQRMNRVFESLEAFTMTGFLLETPGGTEPAFAGRVSAGFFRTLGIRPAVGHDFDTDADRKGAPEVVMLSWGTWMERYGGDASVVGRKLVLSGIPYTVIGVLPREFQFAPLGRSQFWTPLSPTGSCVERRSCHNLNGIARLKPGVTMATAVAEMDGVAKQLEARYPDSNRGQGAIVEPLAELIIGQIRPTLLVLMVGSGLLLLIACANVASLLLVRAEHRRREFAVRGALGASAGRLLSQFATESVLLVGLGGALGLVLSTFAVRFLLSLIPADMLAGMPFLPEAGLSARVLLLAVAVLMLAAAVFSLTPAAHLSWSKLRDGLADGSRGASGMSWSRLGSKLVVLEFAGAMVLLAGAGLLGKSLYSLLHVDLAFDPSHLATMNIASSDRIYGKPAKSIELSNSILREVSALPGVQSAAVGSVLPVTINGNTTWIRFPGRPFNGEHNEVNARSVSARWFRTIGAKVLSGRDFTEADDQAHPRVCIINRKLAQQYFGDGNPLGKQIGNTALTPDSIQEIVGVVDNIREGPLSSEIWPAVYVPFSQESDNFFSLVVRTANDPGGVLGPMRAALTRLHPDIGVREEITMEGRMYISPTASIHRLAAWLAGAFASLALLLGVVGLYGVVAYAVSQRTREIGVRMAMGAAPGAVCRLILRESARLAGIAAVLGLTGSVIAASFMRGLFFGVESWDMPVFSLVTAALLIAALLASYIPARRAALVNPVEALRAD